MAKGKPRVFTANEALELAATKAQELFDLVTETMVTYANNDWISRHRTLVDQVGTSYAANRYNSLARATQAFELTN